MMEPKQINPNLVFFFARAAKLAFIQERNRWLTEIYESEQGLIRFQQTHNPDEPEGFTGSIAFAKARLKDVEYTYQQSLEYLSSVDPFGESIGNLKSIDLNF